MARKTPECIARAAESRLDFVSDIKSAFGMDQIDDALKESGRSRNYSVRGENAVEQHACELDAMAAHVVDLKRNLFAHPGSKIAAFESECVGRGNHAHGLAHGNVVADRGRESGNECRVSVVGLAGYDDAFAAGVKLRAANREVVCLRARAHEHDSIDFAGHGRKKILGIVQDVLVNVARMRVEQAKLLGYCFCDGGVAVPHRGNVVVHVEVFDAVGVE